MGPPQSWHSGGSRAQQGTAGHRDGMFPISPRFAEQVSKSLLALSVCQPADGIYIYIYIYLYLYLDSSILGQRHRALPTVVTEQEGRVCSLEEADGQEQKTPPGLDWALR